MEGFVILKRKKTLRQLDRTLVGSNGIWQKVVKLQAGYKCEICGKTRQQAQLHAHHIITRKARITRYMLENGVCLCSYCHKLGRKSAHESPEWFADQMKEKRSEDWELVHRLEWQIKKWTTPELEELVKEYKLLLKQSDV